MGSSTLQFGRTISLQLLPAAPEQDPFTGQDFEDNTNEALDLSGLKIRFQISASDVETPTTAFIRVYNLSAERVKQIIEGGEFSGVVLSAGYGTNLAQIFKGTVKQFRRGKESNIDSFLDIFAADGDVNYNFGLANASFPANSTPQQRLEMIAKSFGIALDPQAPSFLRSGGILPRGKVLFGLARFFMRDMAASNQVRWSIQDGKLTLIPIAGYLPGDPVVINSATGMIGIPEATDQGISVTILLDPRIKVGQRVQLNNAQISATQIKQQFFPGYTDLNLIATLDTTTDGFYRVIVVDHEGDTRGQEWYSRLICLAIDQTAAAAGKSAVQPFG